MATQIFKDGKMEFCDPLHLSEQIAAGYSLTDGESNEDLSPKEEKDSDKKAYEKELRQEAKALKIKNWHNKKIEKLEIEVLESSSLGEGEDDTN